MPDISTTLGLPTYASNPSSPSAGDIYYNTTTDSIRIYVESSSSGGNRWIDLAGYVVNVYTPGTYTLNPISDGIQFLDYIYLRGSGGGGAGGRVAMSSTTSASAEGAGGGGSPAICAVEGVYVGDISTVTIVVASGGTGGASRSRSKAAGVATTNSGVGSPGTNAGDSYVRLSDVGIGVSDIAWAKGGDGGLPEGSPAGGPGASRSPGPEFYPVVFNLAGLDGGNGGGSGSAGGAGVASTIATTFTSAVGYRPTISNSGAATSIVVTASTGVSTASGTVPGASTGGLQGGGGGGSGGCTGTSAGTAGAGGAGGSGGGGPAGQTRHHYINANNAVLTITTSRGGNGTQGGGGGAGGPITISASSTTNFTNAAITITGGAGGNGGDGLCVIAYRK